MLLQTKNIILIFQKYKLPFQDSHIKIQFCMNKKFSWFGKKQAEKEKDFNTNPESKINHLKEKDNIIFKDYDKDLSNTENAENTKISVFSLQEANKYTEERVKKFDYYAYVIGKTLPEKLKPYYFSYHSFFLEIIRSRYVSREASINRMRLSFWEESLKDILLPEKNIKEPMMIALKEALNNSSIRRDTLFRMIDYQYYDIEKSGDISSMEDLEIFAENTRSLLFYLTLNLFNVDNRDAYLAASHLGRGIGLVDTLKRMPALLKMNINQIPDDIITKNGGSSSNLWDRHGVVRDELFDSILEVAAYAKKHIEISRSFKDKLPKNVNIAFLQGIESYQWLLELEKYNFDIFEPNLAKISTFQIPRDMIDAGKKGLY